MVDLMIDMTEEPVDEDDREFLYTNHLHTAINEFNMPNSVIKGSYSFRSFGMPDDYYKIVRCAFREESVFTSLANS